MPELPEVETLRRSLQRRLPGARIRGLWTSGKPLRLNRPLDVAALQTATVGRRIVALRRWAKYLLVDTDGPHALVVHLGMTGQLRVVPAETPRPPHTHIVWRLEKGDELRYTDVRRFGLVTVVEKGAERELPELAVLGLDPLGPELTAERLHAMARSSRQPLKTFLLDQSRIAGLGNIYVSEALFEARIHPATRANRLTRPRADALRHAVVLVLRRGLENRGTTLRDYQDADGNAGENQHALRVYGREGKSCPRRDGGTVQRVTTQGRATFFCPRCQVR